MKKLTFLFALLFPLLGLTQNLKIDWQSCFGGPSNDIASDIIITEGGYLIAGRNSLYETHGDIMVTKIDTEGNLIWERSYGGSRSDGVARILPTQDGNFFLFGSSSSSDGDISYDPYLGENLDFWIVKIDPDGNIIWDKIYGGNALDQSWKATLASDGGLVVFGWTSSNDGDISDFFGVYDSWLLKLNSEGEKVWDFTMGTASFDYSAAILETSDRGFLATSCSEEYEGGNIQCDAMNENSDISVFKLDSLSNFEWQQCYGASFHETMMDMVETDDGYVLACNTRVGDGDATGSGYHPGISGSAPSSDIWLIKIDFTGNILWQKCYGGSADEVPARIFKSEDGGFLVFGNAGSFDGDVVGNHSSGPGYSDIWVFKINHTGALIWQQCFGGNGYETIESGVVKLSDSHFVVASTMYGLGTGQITCQPSIANEQVWVISVSDSTVGINNQPYQKELIKVYPSPASEYVIFKSDHFKTGLITVSDIYGKSIAKFNMSGKTVWNITILKSGVYLYSVIDGSTIAKGKFVICK